MKRIRCKACIALGLSLVLLAVPVMAASQDICEDALTEAEMDSVEDTDNISEDHEIETAEDEVPEAASEIVYGDELASYDIYQQTVGENVSEAENVVEEELSAEMVSSASELSVGTNSLVLQASDECTFPGHYWSVDYANLYEFTATASGYYTFTTDNTTRNSWVKVFESEKSMDNDNYCQAYYPRWEDECIMAISAGKKYYVMIGQDDSSKYSLKITYSASLSGTCDDTVKWTLSAGGTLTISGTGDMMASRDLTSNSELLYPWEGLQNYVKKLVIKEGVTGIGPNAFAWMENMKTAEIAKSVKTISRYSFYSCYNLKQVTFAEGSSCQFIGPHAFDSMEALDTINLSVATKLTTICYMAFRDCESLETLSIPASVTSIAEKAYSGTYKVSTSNSYYCSSDGILFDKQKSYLISFPRTTIGSYTIPGTVKKIGSGAFTGSQISSVTIPAAVEEIGADAFLRCESLKKVNISASSNITKIAYLAFAYCGNLTEFSLPKKVTGFTKSVFYECKKLAKITVPSDCINYSTYRGAVFNKEKTRLVAVPNAVTQTSYVIPSTVTSVGSYALNGCEKINTVYIPKSVNKILTAAITYNWSTDTYPKLYYAGTKTQWSAISVGRGNEYEIAGYSKAITPEKVLNPKVTNTTSGVKLTWDTELNAEGYYVYRKASGESSYRKYATVTADSGKSTITYTNTSVTSGKSYIYKVRAYSAVSGTVLTGSYSSTVTQKYLKPILSSNLTVSNISSGVKIAWTQVTGATGYRVYRRTVSGSYSKIATITDGTALTYTDTSASNGTCYYYAVRAYSDDYTGSYTGKKTVRLAVSSITSLTNVSGCKFTAVWSKNSKATGYQLQFSDSSSFPSGSTSSATSSSADTLTKTSPVLKKGGTYYVRVRCYKDIDGTRYYSAWSSTKSVVIAR